MFSVDEFSRAKEFEDDRMEEEGNVNSSMSGNVFAHSSIMDMARSVGNQNMMGVLSVSDSEPVRVEEEDAIEISQERLGTITGLMNGRIRELSNGILPIEEIIGVELLGNNGVINLINKEVSILNDENIYDELSEFIDEYEFEKLNGDELSSFTCNQNWNRRDSFYSENGNLFENKYKPFINNLNQFYRDLRYLIKEIKASISSGGFSAKGRARAVPGLEAKILAEIDDEMDRDLGGDKTGEKYSYFQDSVIDGNNLSDLVRVDAVNIEAKKNLPDSNKHIRGKKWDKTAILLAIEGLMAPSTNVEVRRTNPFVKEPRGKGQSHAMGNTSANKYAWATDPVHSDKVDWEWLHIRGAALGGETKSTNLILGTKDCNTHMMPFESHMANLSSLIREKAEWTGLKLLYDLQDNAGQKFTYRKIQMRWEIEGTGDRPKGLVVFKPLETNFILSKSEVGVIEKVLKSSREGKKDEGAMVMEDDEF